VSETLGVLVLQLGFVGLLLVVVYLGWWWHVLAALLELEQPPCLNVVSFG